MSKKEQILGMKKLNPKLTDREICELLGVPLEEFNKIMFGNGIFDMLNNIVKK